MYSVLRLTWKKFVIIPFFLFVCHREKNSQNPTDQFGQWKKILLYNKNIFILQRYYELFCCSQLYSAIFTRNQMGRGAFRILKILVNADL